jgi:hypothetical protein
MELDTHETMKFLTDVERDRFVKFQGLFEHDGWSLLVELATANAAAQLHAGANAQSWEANRFANGARMVWEQIAKLEAALMNEFNILAAERQAELSDEIAEDGDFV